MIALDDAAWAVPWRDVSVGQKVLLSLGLVATALTAPAWPTTILVAISAVTLASGFAKIPPRTLALAFTAPSAFDQLFSADVTQDIAFGPLNLGLSQDKVLKRVRGAAERICCSLGSSSFPGALVWAAGPLTWTRWLPPCTPGAASRSSRITFPLRDPCASCRRTARSTADGCARRVGRRRPQPAGRTFP